jgi:hypothetical protein
VQEDSNKKEKMEDIPLDEKKEPDSDTKSQASLDPKNIKIIEKGKTSCRLHRKSYQKKRFVLTAGVTSMSLAIGQAISRTGISASLNEDDMLAFL